MKSVILTGIALLATSSLVQAQVLASDDFSYTGALTSNGWTAHSGAGNKTIMADGSVATLDESTGSGEDVNLAFTALGATDEVFACFDFLVPAGTVDPDGSGLYFAHFKDATFGFRARTGLLSPTTNDFVLALSSDSSNLGAGVSWATELSFDTTYTVVISYDASTGTSELWLDPVDESSTSITHAGGSGTLIEAFALRQSDDYTGTIDIDNVVVGKSFCDVKPPPITNFCSSGTSFSGCNALLSASGVSSATASTGFVLTATGVEGQKNGLFFFGTTGTQNSPWGFSGSRMCVAAPRFRTPLQFGVGTAGACDGTFSLDMNAVWCPTCPLPAKNPGAGVVCDAQLWYRDPFNPLGNGTALSDGVEWTVCP